MTHDVTARLVVLALAMQLSVAAVPPQQGALLGRVEGTVLDAITGRPVANVSVSRDNGPALIFVSPDVSINAPPGTAMTDSDGRFVLDPVVPGTLAFSARRLGYMDYRLDRQPSRPDVPLTIAPGQVLKDIVVRLMPAAIVRGRVIDFKGEPVTGALVFAFRNAYDDLGAPAPRASVSGITDDRGEFRFNSLPAGSYGFRVERNLVRFGQASPTSFYTTYYPGTRELAKASTVNLEAGKETRLSDILLPSGRGGILSLRIRRDSNAGTNTQIVIWRPGEPTDTLVGALAPEGGVVGQLPPGTYQIEVETGQSRGYALAELGQQDLTVEVMVPNPAVVVGKAGVGDPRDPDRFKPVQGVRIQLMDTIANNSGNRPTLISAADGRFTNPPSVKPGLFHVQSFVIPPTNYLIAVRLGDRDVFGEKFSIEKGAIDLNVILGEGPGVIRGVVRNAEGRAVPGAAVALLPEDRTQKALFASKLADNNGAFELRCAPGAYRLYAWPQLDGAASRNDEFMKPFNDRGIALQVQGEETVSVDVKLVDEVAVRRD